MPRTRRFLPTFFTNIASTYPRATVGAAIPGSGLNLSYLSGMAELGAGKTAISLPWSLTMLGQEYAGKPENQISPAREAPALGMCFNLIGEDGWEMVAYARTPGLRVWMCKLTSK